MVSTGGELPTLVIGEALRLFGTIGFAMAWFAAIPAQSALLKHELMLDVVDSVLSGGAEMFRGPSALTKGREPSRNL